MPMHELSVTQDLLQRTLFHAQQAGARQIRQVNLTVGELAGYVDQSIEFYWNILAEGTLCQNARLQIQKVPARFLCQDCRSEFVVENELIFCPECQSHRAQLIQGDEFYLQSIDIETD